MPIHFLLPLADKVPEKAPTCLIEFLDLFKGIPELKFFHNQYQVWPSGGAQYLTYDFLAHWLIRRGSQHGPKEAVQNIEKFFSSPKIPFHQFFSIDGIQVPEQFTITPELSLIPWDSEILSTSHHKTQIDQNLLPGIHGPSAAIMREVMVPRHAIFSSNLPVPNMSDSTKDLRILAQLLGVLGQHGIRFWYSWKEFPDWVPLNGDPSPQPWIFSNKLQVAPPSPWDTKKLNEWEKLFNSLLKLSKEEQAAIEVPVERLNSSKGQSFLRDSAIDSGIALEALVIDRNQPPEDGIAKTLRQRIPAILDIRGRKKKRVVSLITNFYELRSQAVHTGKVEPKIHQKSSYEVINETHNLISELIQSCIMNGKPLYKNVEGRNICTRLTKKVTDFLRLIRNCGLLGHRP